MKSRKFYLLIILLVFGLWNCKKKEPEKVDYSYMYGNWEVISLTANGIDTTNILKQDSTCFSILKFSYEYVFGNPTYQLELLPFYEHPDSLFECHTFGTWEYNEQVLIMYLPQFTKHYGPYLDSPSCIWIIESKSEAELQLKTQYNAINYKLIIKRK